MKKLFFATMLLMGFYSAIAQNWKCFTPGTNQYFTNNYGYVRGMRIDSVVTTGADNVYHPFRTVRMLNYWMSAVDSNGGSWLGKNVVAQPGGSFLFDNIYGDTVLIETMANVGDNWMFYNDTTNNYYTATISSIDTMTILGNPDSIKRITLTAYVNGVYAPSDSFDNTELVLSKNYGFVQAIDLYNFPYHRPDTVFAYHNVDYIFARSLENPAYYINHNHTFTSYNFASTYAPGKYNCVFRATDFPNPSMAQLGGGWNVGDAIHFSNCYVSSQGCLQTPAYIHYDTITQKNVNGGDITYHYTGRFAAMSGLVGSTPVYTISAHTDSFTYSANEFIQTHMPEEISATMEKSWQYYFYPGDTNYCGPGALFHRVSTNLSFGQIVIVGRGWEPLTLETYKYGLGQVRSFYDPGDPLDGMLYDTTVKFILKNNQSCGVPITVMPAGVEKIKPFNPENIKLYPNPALATINIEAPQNGYNLLLINTLGQNILTKAACGEKETLDVSHLLPGLYYMQLETKEGQLITKKLLIER